MKKEERDEKEGEMPGIQIRQTIAEVSTLRESEK